MRDDDRPSVDLVKEAQLAARHAGDGGDRIPFAVVLAELNRACRKKMVGNFEKRLAPEDRPPWRLRPHEAIVRLGL